MWQVGIVPIGQAIQMAEDAELDLVFLVIYAEIFDCIRLD